jgi:hypothetical protein
MGPSVPQKYEGLPFVNATILAIVLRCSVTILVNFVVIISPHGFAGAAFWNTNKYFRQYCSILVKMYFVRELHSAPEMLTCLFLKPFVSQGQ